MFQWKLRILQKSMKFVSLLKRFIQMESISMQSILLLSLIHIWEDGEYQAIGQDETKGVVLWSSSDHGKNWEETWTFPNQWKNSLVTEAQFTGDGGIFCVLAKDALREGVDTPEASFAYLTPEGVLEEKKLSASQDGLSEIICQNGLVYGRNTSGIVKAYDYKTGEEKKVYDQSGMFANKFVLTKDRVIAIGIDKVEQYDLCLLYTSTNH